MRWGGETGSGPPYPSDLDLRDREPPLDLASLFRVCPESVEVELGSGKGMFLRRSAALRPRSGFIGVERSMKFHRVCAQRLARDGSTHPSKIRAGGAE